MDSTLKRKSIDDTNTTTTVVNEVNATESSSSTSLPTATNKKQKKNNSSSNTIPILRGRFKEKYLTKHSSLIKRSETASGIMITCGLNAETRALGQAQRALDAQLAYYPSYESTWTRFEGEWDVQDLDNIRQNNSEETTTYGNTTESTTEDTTKNTTEDTTEDTTKNTTEDTTKNTTEDTVKDSTEDMTKAAPEKKHRTFQAVDTASSGLIFYRFRVNIKPSQFMDDMIQRLQQQQKDEKETLSTTIRHCSRWLPLDYICHVTSERITDCFATRVLPECIANLPTNTTIAIVTEIRNNTSITKPDLINIIAPQLPSHLKVDLKNPQYVIFVTIFKSVCGMAVLKDYYQRKKYNLGALL